MSVSGILLGIVFMGVFLYAIFQIMLFYDMNSNEYMPYVLFFIFLFVTTGTLPNTIYA